MTSLRQRFTEDMQVRNFSPVTQAPYTREVSGFARHFNKSPELLGPELIRAYQVYLTNERKLGVVSISVATSAIRFLYRVTLKKNWCMADMIPAPKVPKKLPIILSPEEVARFLDCVAMRKHRAVLTTCYAAGLRISEAVALTLPAIDSQRMVLRVEQGKGQRDRYVMLSPKLLEILRAWWRMERPGHWLFPGGTPDQHITTTSVAAMCRRARRISGSPDGGVTAHTFTTSGWCYRGDAAWKSTASIYGDGTWATAQPMPEAALRVFAAAKDTYVIVSWSDSITRLEVHLTGDQLSGFKALQAKYQELP